MRLDMKINKTQSARRKAQAFSWHGNMLGANYYDQGAALDSRSLFWSVCRSIFRVRSINVRYRLRCIQRNMRDKFPGLFTCMWRRFRYFCRMLGRHSMEAA